MNIKKELLEAQTQSKSLATRVADYASSSESNFAELMQCFFSEDYRLAQRAAYCVGIAGPQRPDLLLPYFPDLINLLKKPDVHDALPRNIARIFEVTDIPEAFHGEVLDICFSFLQNRQTAIGIRAYSLTILYKLSLIYPEITGELRYLIETDLPYEKPAIASRSKRILALIKKK